MGPEPDPKHMERAVELALEAVHSGTGGPFGALVVRGGKVLGLGQNRVLEHNDPTAHAEIEAIRQACAAVGDPHLPGAELYASCEPCPMCLAAAYWARIEHIWYSGTARQAASAGFDDEHIHRELATPKGDRSVYVTALMPGAAQVAFDAWASKSGRRIY